MDSKIKASFIPDKVPTDKGGRTPRGSSGSLGDVLMLIGIVALAASLALAAGVFLYDKYLDAQVTSKQQQLDRARGSFEVSLIQELLRLDARLDAAREVLAQHIAPSEFFTILEASTLESVSYESLNFRLEDDNTITIAMDGEAGSVNSVALQASVFGQNTAITNPIFSNLDLVEDGVTFQVTANVNPSALRYANVFNQSSANTTQQRQAIPPAGDAAQQQSADSAQNQEQTQDEPQLEGGESETIPEGTTLPDNAAEDFGGFAPTQ